VDVLLMAIAASAIVREPELRTGAPDAKVPTSDALALADRVVIGCLTTVRT
jgi:hypothetical protein